MSAACGNIGLFWLAVEWLCQHGQGLSGLMVEVWALLCLQLALIGILSNNLIHQIVEVACAVEFAATVCLLLKPFLGVDEPILDVLIERCHALILLFFFVWLPLVHPTVRVELICLLKVYIAIALELESFVHFLMAVSIQSTSAVPSDELASALAFGLLEYSFCCCC